MPAITSHQDGALLIVKFTDDQLHDQEAYRIGTELRALTEQAAGRCLLLNFEGVDYLSSTMIGQLFALRNNCKSKNIAVKICSMTPAVKDVVDIVQLPRMIEVYDDEIAAREALDGEFVVADDDQQRLNIEKLTRDAETGDAAAQFQLGKCYDEGNGVPQSSATAISWYRKAAELGHAEGQFMLGNAYAYGIEIGQDYDLALDWFRKAADQGQVDAQYNLGMSFHYGVGVEEDERQAAAWYSKAAEQGHEPSQVGLRRLGAV